MRRTDGSDAHLAEVGDDVLPDATLDVRHGLRADVGLGGEPLGGVVPEPDLAEARVRPLASQLGVLDVGEEPFGVDSTVEVSSPAPGRSGPGTAPRQRTLCLPSFAEWALTGMTRVAGARKRAPLPSSGLPMLVW